jgi:hypothetical protein
MKLLRQTSNTQDHQNCLSFTPCGCNIDIIKYRTTSFLQLYEISSEINVKKNVIHILVITIRL